MTDILVHSLPPRKRRWPRVLAWLAGSVVVLVVVLYFVATSSAFLKGVILPQVSKSLHADVTVSSASIHPFSGITLRDLKVQPPGQEPIVTAPEIIVRYSLFDILRGNIHVDEITLRDPTVLVIQHPDGTSNLDPLTKAEKKAPEEKPSAPSKPLKIELGKLMLSNATVRQEKLYAGGTRDVTELAKVNVNLENLKNGETGKLNLSAEFRAARNPPEPGQKGLVQGTFNGSFQLTLSTELKPVILQGQSEFAVAVAEGSFADLSGFKSTLTCAVTPAEIKEVALRFQKNETPLGELLVHGPFNMEKSEGRIEVDLSSIDKRLLNLLGASSGLDFGETTVGSTNEIQFANGGSLITAMGRFNVNRLQLTRATQKTPVLDLHSDYHVIVNSAESQALLQTFTLDCAENGAPLLHAGLTSPMNVAWGAASNTMGDSSLNLTVTNFNLADWKPFLGDSAPEGRVGMNAQLLSQQGGQKLSFNLESQIADLAVSIGSNHVAGVGMVFQVRGQASDLKRYSLSDFRLQLTHQSEQALTVSGVGNCDTGNQTSDMQVAVRASLARLCQMLGQPDLAAASGVLECKADFTQKQNVQTIAGNLRLNDLTGQVGQNKFNAFGSTLNFNVTKSPELIKVERITGSLTQAGKPGGSFDLAASYDPASQAATVNATLAGFNESGLGSFVEPLLADKKLVAIAINGNASGRYDPAGKSTIQAAIQVTNLVVTDPKQPSPAEPLEASVRVDVSLEKQSAEVRQMQVSLTPTPRAQNQLQLQGQVDYSTSNAIHGRLNLSADSLDVTRYYDLFAAKKSPPAQSLAPAAPATAPASAPPAAPAGDQEPPATQLPFRDFAVQVNIGAFYLHEVEITNLQTAVNLDGGRVLLNPCQLTLNGAPVKAAVDLDMGIPGYKYTLSFNADRVPFAPLVNTFAPERKGQLGGTLTAHAQIEGAGTTGASLQKNLTGQFNIGTTNLNLSVVNVRSPILKTIINVVATIPELLRSPASAIGSLVGGLTGKGGLMNELSKSPIDVIAARGSAGQGKIDLQEAVVRSPAFLVQARGNVMLESILTNSPIMVPVTVSLSQAVAKQLNLADTTNAYIKLPDFLTIKGTVGEPKSDINKLALLGTTLKAVGGTVPGTNIKPGNVLQGLGGLLGGKTTGSNAVSTNPPAQKQAPVNNLLNNLLRPKK